MKTNTSVQSLIIVLCFQCLAGCAVSPPSDNPSGLSLGLLMVPNKQHDHYRATAVLVGDGSLAVMRVSEWQLEQHDRDGCPILTSVGSASFGSDDFIPRFGFFGGMNERPDATKVMGWWVSAPVWQGLKIDRSKLESASFSILSLTMTYLSRDYEIVYQDFEWQVWPQDESTRKLIPIAE